MPPKQPAALHYTLLVQQAYANDKNIETRGSWHMCATYGWHPDIPHPGQLSKYLAKLSITAQITAATVDACHSCSLCPCHDTLHNAGLRVLCYRCYFTCSTHTQTSTANSSQNHFFKTDLVHPAVSKMTDAINWEVAPNSLPADCFASHWCCCCFHHQKQPTLRNTPLLIWRRRSSCKILRVLGATSFIPRMRITNTSLASGST